MLPVSMNMADGDILEANCTIDDSYMIIMGDERFYRAFGQNTMFTFDRLVHEDDRQEFMAHIVNGSESEPILIRCQIKGEKYRWMFVYKKESDNQLDGHDLYELRFYDVLVQREKFSLYYNNVKKYRSMLTQIKEKIFEYDFSKGIISIYVYINGRAEFIEKDFLDSWQQRMVALDFVDSSQVSAFNDLCDNIRKGVDSFSVTFQSKIMSKGGRRDTLNFRGETLTESTGKTMVVGLISEIGGRIEQKAVLYDNTANKDSATGVLNKKAVTDSIIEAINNANETDKKRMYLAVMDIDDFKSVNDTYGHYFGDEVILSFAAELQRTIGNRGIVGRIGGDEFTVLFTEFDDFDEVKDALKAVRKRLKLKLAEKKQGYTFTISIGIAEYPKDAQSYEELFKISDGCLYIAKEKGKDRHIIYNKEMHGSLIDYEARSGNTNKSAEFMKPIDKSEFAANLMIKVVKDGKASVPHVLEELMDRMNIHGISVFQGEDMHCEYSMGHYSSVIQNAEYALSDKYRKSYNEHGIKVINNIASLSIDFPEVYECFKEHNICSSLQILIQRKDKAQVLISFDIFGEHRRKWSTEDVNTIYMVVKAIANAE